MTREPAALDGSVPWLSPSRDTDGEGEVMIVDKPTACDDDRIEPISPAVVRIDAPAADRATADRRAVFLSIASLRDGLPAVGPDLAELTDAQRSLLVDALRTMDRNGAPWRPQHDTWQQQQEKEHNHAPQSTHCSHM